MLGQYAGPITANEQRTALAAQRTQRGPADHDRLGRLPRLECGRRIPPGLSPAGRGDDAGLRHARLGLLERAAALVQCFAFRRLVLLRLHGRRRPWTGPCRRRAACLTCPPIPRTRWLPSWHTWWACFWWASSPTTSSSVARSSRPIFLATAS